MNAYRITNTVSSVDLGVYQADDERGALDAMARDAGYTDYAAAWRAAAVVDGEIRVDLVSPLEPLAPAAGQRMVAVVTLPAYTYETPELATAGQALAVAMQERGDAVVTVPFAWDGGTIRLPDTWPEAERRGAAAVVAYALREQTDISVAWYAEGVVRLDLSAPDHPAEVYLSARHLTHDNPMGL